MHGTVNADGHGLCIVRIIKYSHQYGSVPFIFYGNRLDIYFRASVLNLYHAAGCTRLIQALSICLYVKIVGNYVIFRNNL